MDLISMVEATLEDPRQVLRAQERKAREKAMAEMKADGVDYEERLDRIGDVTYPKPLEEMLDAAFVQYCEAVPWARDYQLAPKSVLRDMLETASDFKEYVARYGIARSEGTFLRYLSDAYRVLDRTVPFDKRDDRLKTSFHGLAWWFARSTPAWSTNGRLQARWKMLRRRPKRMPWCATAAASRCSCATRCSAVCALPLRTR